MKTLVAIYEREMEDVENESRAEAEPRIVPWKLTVTRQTESEELLAMGILSSDEDDSITDDRNRLLAATIEAIQCQKNCLDNNLQRLRAHFRDSTIPCCVW